MVKVGDIVASAPHVWASGNVGKKGIVKAVYVDYIVVEMLEAMPDIDVEAGYEWWLTADNWVKVQTKPFVCKSLL